MSSITRHSFSGYGIVLCIILNLFCSGLFAQLGTGFKALKEYDFFKARHIFKKELRKNPAPAAFGLALIHNDRLNHFYSLDSAFIRIEQSQNSWNILEDRKSVV
jgi:hypothetical protein